MIKIFTALACATWIQAQITQYVGGIYKAQWITFDSSDNLYWVDYQLGTVMKYTTTGIVSLISTGYFQPFGLDLDGKGSLYVAEYGYNSSGSTGIKKVNISTGTSTLMASTNQSYSVQVDLYGNLYYIDNRGEVIKKRNVNGQITILEKTVSWFSDLVVDSIGNLYYGEMYPNIHENANILGVLYKRDVNGVKSVVSYLEFVPNYIVMDRLKNFYFSDLNNSSRVFKFSLNGNISQIPISPPFTATSIAIDSKGDLYVVSNYTDVMRVPVVQKLGKSCPLAGKPCAIGLVCKDSQCQQPLKPGARCSHQPYSFCSNSKCIDGFCKSTLNVGSSCTVPSVSTRCIEGDASCIHGICVHFIHTLGDACDQVNVCRISGSACLEGKCKMLVSTLGGSCDSLHVCHISNMKSICFNGKCTKSS